MMLADFLLARIAEDEGVIRFSRDCGEPVPVAHEQMLAECEAKRRIVDELTDSGHATVDADGERILRALALPYVDRPDYREEWRP